MVGTRNWMKRKSGEATQKSGEATQKSGGVMVALATAALLCLIGGSASADTYVSDNIRQNTIWTTGGSPYIIEGVNPPANRVIEVRNGSTLTIDPGVEIRFEPGTRIITEAPGSSIVAVGTPGSGIVFTSNAGVPAPGDWDEVGVYSSPSSEFQYCTFEYASRGLYLSLSPATMLIKKCRFENCGIGLYFRHASAQVEECQFEPAVFYNVLSYYSDSLPTFWHCNFIPSRATANIRLEDYATPETVYAQFNWWGSSDTTDIKESIVDSTDNEPGNPLYGKGVVDYAPWLDQVPVEVSSWGRIKALFR